MRPTITPDQCAAARAAVPGPSGFSWEWDPAAPDRLRLFPGYVCCAYADGSWDVVDLIKFPVVAHQGVEPSLEDAMKRALKVAEDVGWTMLVTT